MPVTTVRYSAALEQTYEEEEEDATGQRGRTAKEEGRATSTMSTSSSSSSCGDPLNNSSIGAADEGPADDQSSVCGSCSGSSTTSGGGEHSRQASVDGTEFIPTRTLKASTAGRPAFNPLQFVKTGNVFYKKTEQQSQHEDVRKVKEMVKEEEEAWQSNLDNWKSKRRQISHQTIQRAEEIKQIEEIEHDRQRKKSKTFTEILQDRSKRRASSVKLPFYRDDEDDDASGGHVWKDNNNDSGWSSDRGNKKNVAGLPLPPKLDASLDSSGSDGVFHDDDEDADGQHHDSRQTGHDKRPDKDLDEATNEAQTTGIGNGSSNKDKDEVVAKEEEVYTFEKAIRSYVEFAESRKTTSTPSSTLREKDKAVEQTTFSDSGAKGHCSRQYDDDSSIEEKSAMKSPPSSLHDAQNEQRQEQRAEGDELSIIVFLKRGSGESKDFGFTTKTVVTGDGGTNNVFVESLVPGGAAAASGLRVGDEVLAINCECTSNRTHSAIVFAVKQAVYTGRLELHIYRYAHLPLAASTSGNPSSSSLDDSGSEDVRRRRRHDQNTTTKTKVVTERRSMFEASSQVSHGRVDTTLHRRSLDFSGSNGNMSSLRDKLASFENLDLDSRSSSPGSGSRHRMGLRRTPERDSTFERKLASFKSMDSLNDQRAKDRPQLINNNHRGSRGGEAFRQKLSSFENLNNVDARRSRSCDFLNDVGCGSDNETGEEAVAEVGSHLAKPEDDRPSSWRRLTMSDVDDGLEHLITAEESIKKDVVDEQRLLTPPGLPTPSEQVEGESYDPQMNKSGFALAMDLPETAITWSECNSPTPSCHDDQSISTSALEGTHQAGDTFNLEASTVTDIWQEEEGQELQEVQQEEVDFDLPRPSTLLEPPKEKPPPPPIDGSRTTTTHSSANVKRMSSTKRIRKEICRRRSDFLGFEADVIDIGANCVTATPPKPEMRSQVDDPHDEHRSSSSISSCVDITSNSKSEEDEMARKEREIIQNLEREEQQLNHAPTIGVNVATMDSVEDEISRLEEERKLREREEILRRQEEVLQREKEKLRLEQQRLLREKEAYKKQIHEHHRIGNASGEIDDDSHLLDRREYVLAIEKPSRAATDPLPSPQQAPLPPPPPPPSKPKMKTDLSPLHIESRVPTRQKPSSPPIGHLLLRVDETVGGPQIRENSFTPNAVAASTSSRSPSSKQMIHALSASPRARLKDSDQWMAEHGRNSASNVHDCNNGYSRQHWLVQEAEMRRLIQQQDREANNNNDKLRNMNNNIERVPPAATQHRQSLGHCSRPTTSNVVVDRLNAPPRNAPQQVQQQNMHHHLSGLSTSKGPLQHANPPPARHSSPGPAKLAAGRPVHGSADQQSTSMLMPPPPPAQPLRSSPLQPTKHNGGHGPVTLNDTVLSVSGKKKCSHCSQELGRGAAMIVESLGLYYHIECFKCCVCLVKLGNGSSGTDVRVRNHKLHCHNCYSNDEGLKFSKV